MSKVRKIVHLEVFDFEESEHSYALSTNKNKFGYVYKNEYFYGKKKILETPLIDNVSNKEIYWKLFGMNLDQLKSLRRKVNKLLDRGFAYDSLRGKEINVNVSGGSTIKYRGNNSSEFFQKVLGLERNK